MYPLSAGQSSVKLAHYVLNHGLSLPGTPGSVNVPAVKIAVIL
jgi:hypothetical protein